MRRPNRMESEIALAIDATWGVPLVLLGCRPLEPYRGIPADQLPFHAEPTDRYHPESAAMPWPSGSDRDPCLVCGFGPQDRMASSGRNVVVYCVACDSFDPYHEALGSESRTEAENAKLYQQREKTRLSGKIEKAKERLRQHSSPLTEADRRRLWNGYGSTLDRELDLTSEESGKVANRAKLGRDFLREIGQVPDWTKKLAKRTPYPDDAEAGQSRLETSVGYKWG